MNLQLTTTYSKQKVTPESFKLLKVMLSITVQVNF